MPPLQGLFYVAAVFAPIFLPKLSLDIKPLESAYFLGAGLNMNTMDNSEVLGSGIDKKLALGLSGAFKIEYHIDKDWSYRTGLWFQKKNVEFSRNYLNKTQDVKAYALYASVPLNIMYKVSKHMAIFGGYNADLRVEEDCTANLDSNSCPLKNNARPIVHVATLGMSVFNRKGLSADLSWQHSLSDNFENVKIHTLQAMIYQEL